MENPNIEFRNTNNAKIPIFEIQNKPKPRPMSLLPSLPVQIDKLFP
jgi:hypothetical protein